MFDIQPPLGLDMPQAPAVLLQLLLLSATGDWLAVQRLIRQVWRTSPAWMNFAYFRCSFFIGTLTRCGDAPSPSDGYILDMQT